jgi:glycosyltransferase involved in cell wall biosynthesis
MRVLLCHQPTDGGVGRHVRDLADGLSAKEHEVFLCSPAIPQGVSAPVVHVRLALRRAVAPRADLVALVRLAQIVKELRPDVVHAHSSKAGALARLARFSSPRVPVVYTPHGFAFAGHFSHPLERHIYLGAERVLAPLTSRVVCVCESEARLARSIGPKDRVRVIPNGIDPPGKGQADPRVAELSRRGPVIGALTLLRPGKGMETLIAAVPHVLARHPEAQVAIVGDGPDRQKLGAQASALGIAGSVHFLGPSNDPLAALRGMDVFVHSSWAESFPYVILEAMSLARPIVASDVGGVGEAVIDGKSGLLIPARNECALGAALVGLLDDPERRADLGRGALQRAGLFTRLTMIEQLVGVYDEIVRT